MVKAVSQIINKIPKGVLFDSHYVIRMIRRYHSSTYGKFFKSTTISTNGRIGKVIKSLKGLVKQQVLKSFSENVHGKSSKCTLWKRI